MDEHAFCANSALSSLRQLTPEGSGVLEQIPTGLRASHRRGLAEHLLEVVIPWLCDPGLNVSGPQFPHL